MGPMDRWYQGPKILSIYGGTVDGRNETDFGFWYHESEHVYESAPRDYLEKEIQFLENLIIKMGRRYEPRIVASHFAAKDVHHRYYDGRIRDPKRDATISRGPMYTGQGRKNTGQGLGHPSESAES